MPRNHPIIIIWIAVTLSAAIFTSLFFAGCATVEAHPEIPGAAIMGSEGSGRLAYTAPDDGTVYIYDVTEEQIAYSGRVRTGETITVNPDDDRITVDGRLVSEKELNEGNLHRLYFMPESPRGERRIRVEERRIEERRIEER
jgi:hypothetical protein